MFLTGLISKSIEPPKLALLSVRLDLAIPLLEIKIPEHPLRCRTERPTHMGPRGRNERSMILLKSPSNNPYCGSPTGHSATPSPARSLMAAPTQGTAGGGCCKYLSFGASSSSAAKPLVGEGWGGGSAHIILGATPRDRPEVPADPGISWRSPPPLDGPALTAGRPSTGTYRPP